MKQEDTITNTFYCANNFSSFLLLHLESKLNKVTPVNQVFIFCFCINCALLYNFKGYFTLTGITQYWLYSPRCTTKPWAYLTSSSFYLQFPHLYIAFTPLPSDSQEVRMGRERQKPGRWHSLPLHHPPPQPPPTSPSQVNSEFSAEKNAPLGLN